MTPSLKQKLASYKPTQTAINLVDKTKILLLVGISGAGKDTLKTNLIKRGGYHHIISHTTRHPRLNHGVLEQDGIDYHFISLHQAEQMIDKQAFIEVKTYSGNVYGTSVDEILTANKSAKVAITDLEIQGVAEYKALSSDVRAVFLLPPSYKVWQERLSRRYSGGNIDQEDVARRMQTAKQELDHALQTNYFHFIVNDDLEKTIDEIDNFVHQKTSQSTDLESRKLAEEIAKKLEY